MDKTELSKKFENPEYLPSHKDFFSLFEEQSFVDAPGFNWMKYSNMVGKENPIFELWTKEYIESLSEYIISRKYPESPSPTLILEVAAGNGRLSYFLNKYLEQVAPDKFKILAIDSGIENYPPNFPVEKINHKKAIKKYKPALIICAWMPMNKDLSATFRKAKSTEEYILIGPYHLNIIGKAWKTWGMGHKRVKNIFGQKLLPPYQKDGFEMHKLTNLAPKQICKMDTPKRLSQNIYLSRTVSFRKIIK